MSDRSQATLELVADLRPALDGRALVACSVGPAGEAVALAVDGRRVAAMEWFQPVEAVAIVANGTRIHATELAGVVACSPRVQPLPRGELLVAGSAQRRGEPNAAVFGSDGALRRRFALGDAIGDLQTTADGSIWVSYYDEGVYGGGIASAGLVRFDADGEVESQFEQDAGGVFISDCYALNVTDEAVWAFIYGDPFPFFLARVEDGRVARVWDAAGWRGDSLATDGRVVLLARRGRASVSLHPLAAETLQVGCPMALARPDGVPLLPGIRLAGRGTQLHVFDGGLWFRLSVESLR